MIYSFSIPSAVRRDDSAVSAVVAVWCGHDAGDAWMHELGERMKDMDATKCGKWRWLNEERGGVALAVGGVKKELED